MKISGIYQIQSKIKPERVYIGSAVNIQNRWFVHLCDLRKNKHGNSRLQNHYNKYGETDLVFSILTGCDKDALIKNEQFFIDSINPFFNICKSAGSPLGRKHSKETREKISKLKKGIPSKRKGICHSEESKLKMSLSHLGQRKGVKFTEEHKAKLREACIGKKNHQYGKHLSVELRKRLSEIHKGKNTWMKGRAPSVDTKRKLSESGKKAWEIRRLKKVA